MTGRQHVGPLTLDVLTSTQRNALPSPTTGDAIYNSTTGQLETYNGTVWNTSAKATGEIAMFGGTVAPAGSVMCDGASYLRAGPMAALFAVIGTAYGSADGTHFNVPNIQEKFPLGAGATHALGATGGATTHSHTVGTIAAGSHTHTMGNHTHDGGAMYAAADPSNSGSLMHWLRRTPVSGWTGDIQTAATGAAVGGDTGSPHTIGVQILGSSTAPNNNTTDATTPGMSGSTATAAGPIDPFVTVNFIIKT